VILNRFERLLVNQPLRPWMQRWIEARPLRRMGGRLAGGRVLELGCGQGEGARILLRDFGATEVHAFDLDSRQIARARRRTTDLVQQGRLKYWQGDATQLPVPADVYQAAFDFNVLHHLPDWRSAVQEVARVLHPGGRFYLLETLSRFIDHPISRRLMEHPRSDRFDSVSLEQALQAAGFKIRKKRSLAGSFIWLVAELADQPSPL
jgi:ubiquinone/menaquinone biosynthesis C-methylase UbiE